jgi:hypothetical protein
MIKRLHADQDLARLRPVWRTEDPGVVELVVAAGGKDNGKPGVRENYSANYYAAFVIDPDGHRIEAYCGSAA